MTLKVSGMNEMLNSWTDFTGTPHYEITFLKIPMSSAVKWFHAYKEKGGQTEGQQC